MKIVIVKDYEEMSEKAAKIIAEQISTNPHSVLGLATGGTPESTYDILINNHALDWTNIHTFNLDEYIGIPKEHKMSYHTYMNDKLFDHINIQQPNIHIPDGEKDPKVFGPKYDKKISEAGGIDLQILGIGENAHIGFNEPGSTSDEGTREVDLTQSTIEANSRYFDNIKDVPTKAITMGIGSILKAKKILLLASGIKKADAIKNTIEGNVSSEHPSSFLQDHKDVTIIIDRAAASKLN